MLEIEVKRKPNIQKKPTLISNPAPHNFRAGLNGGKGGFCGGPEDCDRYHPGKIFKGWPFGINI